jgi:hypothetical protein
MAQYARKEGYPHLQAHMKKGRLTPPFSSQTQKSPIVIPRDYSA